MFFHDVLHSEERKPLRCCNPVILKSLYLQVGFTVSSICIPDVLEPIGVRGDSP